MPWLLDIYIILKEFQDESQIAQDFYFRSNSILNTFNMLQSVDIRKLHNAFRMTNIWVIYISIYNIYLIFIINTDLTTTIIPQNIYQKVIRHDCLTALQIIINVTWSIEARFHKKRFLHNLLNNNYIMICNIIFQVLYRQDNCIPSFNIPLNNNNSY